MQERFFSKRKRSYATKPKIDDEDIVEERDVRRRLGREEGFIFLNDAGTTATRTKMMRDSRRRNYSL